jgi:hypothetical protein
VRPDTSFGFLNGGTQGHSESSHFHEIAVSLTLTKAFQALSAFISGQKFERLAVVGLHRYKRPNFKRAL